MREYGRGLGRLAELAVEVLDSIGRVDHAPDRFRIPVKRRKVRPSDLPAFEVRLVARPAFHHIGQGLASRFLGGRGIDLFEILAERLAILEWNKHDRVPNLVRDADLHVGVGKYRLDRLGKAFETVHAGDEDVLDAAIFEIREYTHPELGTFTVADPDAQHFLLAVLVDAQGDIGDLGRDLARFAHFEAQTVQIQDRIAGREHARLPFLDQGKHLVGDGRDARLRKLHAVVHLHIAHDVARGHAFGVEAYDHGPLRIRNQRGGEIQKLKRRDRGQIYLLRVYERKRSQL